MAASITSRDEAVKLVFGADLFGGAEEGGQQGLLHSQRSGLLSHRHRHSDPGRLEKGFGSCSRFVHRPLLFTYWLSVTVAP